MNEIFSKLNRREKRMLSILLGLSALISAVFLSVSVYRSKEIQQLTMEMSEVKNELVRVKNENIELQSFIAKENERITSVEKEAEMVYEELQKCLAKCLLSNVNLLNLTLILKNFMPMSSPMIQLGVGGLWSRPLSSFNSVTKRFFTAGNLWKGAVDSFIIS